MNKIFFILIVSLLYCGLGFAQDSDSQKIDSKHFKRLYQINDSIYRAEQPNKKGFKELESSGVKTILNLRRLRNDSAKAKGTLLQLVHLPMKTAKLNESDIVEALKAIQSSEKPLLIHCWHGSDRTGVVTAAFRIVFENWTKERAIAEFRNKDFGYHERKYPNLIVLLEKLDVQKIRMLLDI